jgi:hypothetical protein
MLFAVLLLGLGIIAQIGIYNYYSGNQAPFSVREQTPSHAIHE